MPVHLFQRWVPCPKAAKIQALGTKLFDHVSHSLKVLKPMHLWKMMKLSPWKDPYFDRSCFFASLRTGLDGIQIISTSSRAWVGKSMRVLDCLKVSAFWILLINASYKVSPRMVLHRECNSIEPPSCNDCGWACYPRFHEANVSNDSTYTMYSS